MNPPTMLRTPPSFISLLTAQEHAEPLNFVFCGDELMVCEEDLALPHPMATLMMGLKSSQFHPVGLLDGRYCQTTWVARGTPPAEGHRYSKMRALFGALDEQLVSVAGRAFQIAEWARTHKFCGACATPTQHQPGERCVKCPACGMVAYPRISPAMMVLIKRGDSILLARHHNSPTRFYTALAGFVEAGESIEDAVHREIFEEVGLKVRDLAYFGSQPWPFPHSLMIAFTAEYESGDIRVDETEIAQAQWFGPGDEMPRTPPMGLSIAGHLINANLPKA
jgi:NAD+ diphosphatase